MKSKVETPIASEDNFKKFEESQFYKTLLSYLRGYQTLPKINEILFSKLGVYKLEKGTVIFKEKEIPELLVYLAEGEISRYRKKDDLEDINEWSSIPIIEEERSSCNNFGEGNIDQTSKDSFDTIEGRKASGNFLKVHPTKEGNSPTKKDSRKPSFSDLVSLMDADSNAERMSRLLLQKASNSIAKLHQSQVFGRKSKIHFSPVNYMSMNNFKIKNPEEKIEGLSFGFVSKKELAKNCIKRNVITEGKSVAESNFYLGMENRERYIVSSKEAIVVILRAEYYERMLQEANFLFKNKIREVWSKFKIFEYWEKRNRLDKLMDIAMPFCLDQGQYLFRKGHEIKNFYILLDGELEVNKVKKVKQLKDIEDEFKDESAKFDKNFARKKIKNKMVGFERILKAPNIVCELGAMDLISKEKKFYNYSCKVKSNKAFFMKISRELIRISSVVGNYEFKQNVKEMKKRLKKEEKMRLFATVKDRLPIKENFSLEKNFEKNLHKKKKRLQKSDPILVEHIASYNYDSQKIKYIRSVNRQKLDLNSDAFYRNYLERQRKIKDYRGHLSKKIADLEEKNRNPQEIQFMDRMEIKRIIRKKEKERLMKALREASGSPEIAQQEKKGEKKKSSRKKKIKLVDRSNKKPVIKRSPTIKKFKKAGKKVSNINKFLGKRVSKVEMLFEKVELKSQYAYSLMKNNYDDTKKLDMDKIEDRLLSEKQKRLKFLMAMDTKSKIQFKRDSGSPLSRVSFNSKGSQKSNLTPRSTRNIPDIQISWTTRNSNSNANKIASSSFSNLFNLHSDRSRVKNFDRLPSIEIVEEERSAIPGVIDQEAVPKKKEEKKEKFKELGNKELIDHLKEGNCLFTFDKRPKLSTNLEENLYYNEMMISFLRFSNYVKELKKYNERKERESSSSRDISEFGAPSKGNIIKLKVPGNNMYNIRKVRSSVLNPLLPMPKKGNVTLPFYIKKNHKTTLGKKNKSTKNFDSNASTRPTNRRTIKLNLDSTRAKSVMMKGNRICTLNSVERLTTYHKDPMKYFSDLRDEKKKDWNRDTRLYKKVKKKEGIKNKTFYNKKIKYRVRNEKRKLRTKRAIKTAGKLGFVQVRCLTSENFRKVKKGNKYF